MYYGCLKNYKRIQKNKGVNIIKAHEYILHLNKCNKTLNKLYFK